MAGKIRKSNLHNDVKTMVTDMISEQALDSANFDSVLASKTTDDITEGSTNQYYTSTRADSDFDIRLATKTTGDISEGSNLYYTTSRADSDFDVRLATKTTDNLTEGSNQYYTDARADARIAAASLTDISDADQTVRTTDNVTFADLTLTGSLIGPSTMYVDPAPVDSDAGLLVIRGDLQVDGTTTTVNSTTVSINDKNIVLADSAANASEADGAGITVNGASATIQYDAADDLWEFNKGIKTTNSNLFINEQRISTNGNGEVGIGYGKSGTGNIFAVYDGTAGEFFVQRDGDVLMPNGYVHIGNTSGGSNRGVTINPNGEVTQNATDGSWLHLNRYVDGNVAVGHSSSANLYAKNNVGIGTDSPWDKLAVYGGGIHFGTAPSSNNSGRLTYNTVSGDMYVSAHSTGGNTSMGFVTSNSGSQTTNMKITYDGNVGIGTDSPSALLHLYSSSNDTPLYIDTGNANGAHLRFLQAGSVKHFLGCGGGISLGDKDDLTMRAYDNILFASGNSSTERMRITSNGDVSIGSGHAGFSGWRVLNMRQLSTGALVNFEDDDGTRAFTFASQGSGMRYQAHISGGYHRWETNATANALYITDGGNVGIGTNNPAASLDVSGGNVRLDGGWNMEWGSGYGGGAASIWSDAATTSKLRFAPTGNSGGIVMEITDSNTYITSNVRIGSTTIGNEKLNIAFSGRGGMQVGSTNGSGAYIVLDGAADGDASGGDYAYIEHNSSGALAFNTGNVNNSTSTKMVIEAAGNVGIGTTNPVGKLHVNTGSGTSDPTNTLAIERSSSSDYSAISFRTGSTTDWSIGHNATGGFEIYENGADVTTRLTIKDGGNLGLREKSPLVDLHLTNTTSGSSGYGAYGHPATGGRNGAIYIEKSNSRFDWDDGLVFAGEGASWSMRVTARNGLVTNSDTDGEIFGVHPVEANATAWTDTAGADNVTDAYFRVMGNGTVWVGARKLNGLGLSSTFPANSAKEIKNDDPNAQDGLYWITVSGQGAVQVYCDMTTDGGGWTLVYKTHHINQHNFVWPSSNTYHSAGIDPRSSNNASIECNLPNKYSDYGVNTTTAATEFLIEEYDYGSGDADFVYKYPFTSSVGSTWESGTNGLATNLIPASLSTTSIVDRCVDNNGVRPTTDTLSGGGSYLTDKASPGSAGNWDIGGPSTGSSGQNLKDANCNRYGGGGPGLFRSSSLLLWVR